MKNFAFTLAIVAAWTAFGSASEISVNIKFDCADYVVGERIRAVVDVANSSPVTVSYGYEDSKDKFLIEVYRASDNEQLTRTGSRQFVSRFHLRAGEGQKLETFLGDHFALKKAGRYLAKPVLIHKGIRYVGSPRAFDVVDGLKVGSALQMFANRDGLRRDFELCYWFRTDGEHLFLKAWDSNESGPIGVVWETRDLGKLMRINNPSVSVLPTGEVVVLHRVDADRFARSEFWSLPNELLFREVKSVRDPETAGTDRVRELYEEKKLEAKDNPWWKFW